MSRTDWNRLNLNRMNRWSHSSSSPLISIRSDDGGRLNRWTKLFILYLTGAFHLLLSTWLYYWTVLSHFLLKIISDFSIWFWAVPRVRDALKKTATRQMESMYFKFSEKVMRSKVDKAHLWIHLNPVPAAQLAKNSTVWIHMYKVSKFIRRHL